MTEYKLDIIGKVCPYCLLAVRKKVKELSSGDTLLVLTDHPPAANDTIPSDMEKLGYNVKSTLLEPGVWELTVDIP
ncbi:MAG: sulfurtransferase TusA family protein [Candidatus Lokiarchaeota archaeon]|nr:sulfurtransferase TusA family protein [Candidatus Lokiarchaeota archaeon]